MRLTSFLAVTVLLVACASKPSAPLPEPLKVPPYGPLLAQARAQDTTLDFTDLRLAYTGSPDYAPYGVRDSDFRKAMYVAADSESFGSAMGWADSILAVNFVDIEAHGVASYALAQLGDSTRSDYHRWVTTGLLTSIDDSGDGSEAHPYLVISVAEEYAWASYRGFNRKGIQSLGECNHHPCDSVEFTNRRTQQDTTFHFDVSIPYNAMTRTLKE
jgi:hypothetical protein